MMTKEKRITLFLITMAGLTIVFLVTKNNITVSPEIFVVIFSTLIMLSFTALFVEHFFTTPSDVLANTISILLAISPIRSSLSRFGNWYWIFFSYNLLFLITSLLSLLLLNSQKSSLSLQNRVSNTLKRLSTFFGNGQFLFFVLFFLTILFYIDVQSVEFLVLFGYATFILLLNPSRFILNSLSTRKGRRNDVGKIIGIQSKNTFIAKLYEDRPDINRFDFVEFRYAMNENRETSRGLVIDKYFLNEEQWIKVLVSDEIKSAFSHIDCGQIAQSNVVHKLDCSEPPGFLQRYVGIVQENSTIGKIRFEYHSKIPVSEGDLLELNANQHNVLYQIVQGFTDTELLESKNKTGFVVGEAVQLGLWESERQIFNKYGWVPDINTPVYLGIRY